MPYACAVWLLRYSLRPVKYNLRMINSSPEAGAIKIPDKEVELGDAQRNELDRRLYLARLHANRGRTWDEIYAEFISVRRALPSVLETFREYM